MSRALYQSIQTALQQGRFIDADKLLKSAPAQDLNFIFLAGISALYQKRFDDAAKHFARALQQKPDWAEAAFNLIQADINRGNFNAAIKLAESWLPRTPTPAPALLLASAAEATGDQARANDAYAEAITRSANDPSIISNLWLGRRKLWDWRTPLPEFTPDMLTPAAATVLSDDPAFQKQVAELWCKKYLPPSRPAPAKRAQSGRVRIGYLSSDIHHHATAYLIAELFELHNRDRFEIFCFSYGQDDGSAIRTRIKNTAENFIDLADASPAEFLPRLIDANLDVLIDLKGHTRGHALPLLAGRAAPVQIHYLGHPGTIGADFIDYLVADPTVVPLGDENYYSEHILRLPHCYQINDRKRAVAMPQPRHAYGLPDDKIVLACFNQSYKLTPDVFSDWCDILRANSSTVLWLYCNVQGAEENLRTTLATYSIAQDRLIIAPPLPNDQHIARYQAADIILDTYPYTSHTTASDALWAGVPLVTRIGCTYPARVAASILHNVGLDELITTTRDEYKNLVLALAADKPRRDALRSQLIASRDTAPLWNTTQWVRDWETELLKII